MKGRDRWPLFWNLIHKHISTISADGTKGHNPINWNKRKESNLLWRSATQEIARCSLWQRDPHRTRNWYNGLAWGKWPELRDDELLHYSEKDLTSQKGATSMHRSWFYVVREPSSNFCSCTSNNEPSLWSSGQSSRGPVFDFRGYQTFWEVVGLERGPLRFMGITEELFDWKSSGSGIENRD
jgi:hypothetical protein